MNIFWVILGGGSNCDRKEQSSCKLGPSTCCSNVSLSSRQHQDQAMTHNEIAGGEIGIDFTI